MGFSQKHHLHKLVYYELHPSKDSALLREKRMNEWKRAWKIKRIEKSIRTGETYTRILLNLNRCVKDARYRPAPVRLLGLQSQDGIQCL